MNDKSLIEILRGIDKEALRLSLDGRASLEMYSLGLKLLNKLPEIITALEKSR